MFDLSCEVLAKLGRLGRLLRRMRKSDTDASSSATTARPTITPIRIIVSPITSIFFQIKYKLHTRFYSAKINCSIFMIVRNEVRMILQLLEINFYKRTK